MGGGKNDFFITATIRELASVTCHAVKRWRFAPFDKFTFHFPMRMPDVTIFGCTPDITIRTNCQRTRLIQRAGCTSKFSTGNQVSSGLCYITRCGYFFSKIFCSPTGHNSFCRPILDVVHPVSRLEGERFDVLDLFGDDGLHHLAHRSAFHKIAELATDVLAVLPPNFLVLPGQVRSKVFRDLCRPGGDDFTVAFQRLNNFRDTVI